MPFSVSGFPSPLSLRSVHRFNSLFATELWCSSEGRLFRLRIAEMTGTDQMRKRWDEMRWYRVLLKTNEAASVFRMNKERGGDSDPKPWSDSVDVLFFPSLSSALLLHCFHLSVISAETSWADQCNLFPSAYWAANQRRVTFLPCSRNNQ